MLSIPKKIFQVIQSTKVGGQNLIFITSFKQAYVDNLKYFSNSSLKLKRQQTDKIKEVTKMRRIARKCSTEQWQFMVTFFSLKGKQISLLHENSWIFNMDDALFQQKYAIIKQMNFEKMSHTIPYFRLPVSTLTKITTTLKKDERKGLCKNRLYFLCEHLQCDPYILGTHLVKSLPIYQIPFTRLRHSLNLLLEMGVPADRIVNDIWALKSDPKRIKDRLDKVKATGVDVLAPWMVRCEEHILTRSISLATSTKEILGDNMSAESYLASRLNTKSHIVADIYSKHPTVKKIRVPKVKVFLDFLFAEGFTEDEILKVPYILTHSLEKVRLRLEKLRGACIDFSSNLSILCKSEKNFTKYYETMVYVSNIKKEDCELKN